MITFICALPQEAKYLRKLTQVQSGEATVVCCGIGPLKAERATRQSLANSKSSLVISTGVAGALSPSMKVGDIVVANEVIDEAGGERFNCHPPSSIFHPPCLLLSVARMITSTEEKQSLARKYNAVAVDMESAAVARVCAGYQIRFAAVRAISDTANEALPEAVPRFFDAEGNFRPVRVMAEIGKDLSLLKDLRRLQRQTAMACESLCAFLGKHPF